MSGYLPSSLPARSSTGRDELEQALTQALQEHAPDALVTHLSADFLDVYLETLKRGLHAYRITAEEKEDLAQEVCVRVLCAFRTRPLQGGTEGVRRWLCTLLRRKALDTIRYRARHAALSLEATLESAEEPESSDPSPEDALQQGWDREFIQTLLDQLRKQVAEAHYLVFYLRTMEEYSVVETANLTGLTEHAVRRITSRVKERFERLALLYRGKEYGPDPGSPELEQPRGWG
jgi:RNA polymerase sigma factor (sigma-70 family)